MAQKRMIDKKISVSEQVANLAIEAQLIFTWAIVHADDLGLLPRSERTLRAMVVPMLDITAKAFGNHLEAIVSQGLMEEFTYQKEKFYRVINFKDHQTLKKDRQPQTLLKIPLNSNPKITWENVEAIMEGKDFQLEDTDFHLDSEVKRSEVKRREDIYTLTSFEEFWKEYPNKKAKKKAEGIWKRIKPTEELFKVIMAGLSKAKQSAQWRKDGGQYIPHPTTWLNQERWTDEVSTDVPRAKAVKV